MVCPHMTTALIRRRHLLVAASGRLLFRSNGMAKSDLFLTIRLLRSSGGPEARSSRGGGAPRERAGVGPRPESNNADRTPVVTSLPSRSTTARNPTELLHRVPSPPVKVMRRADAVRHVFWERKRMAA